MKTEIYYIVTYVSFVGGYPYMETELYKHDEKELAEKRVEDYKAETLEEYSHWKTVEDNDSGFTMMSDDESEFIKVNLEITEQ